ncbi:MAG: amino acid permease [Victivallales bacterium]|nr:amino acid permease [Victivallales bacterium]
MNRHNEAKPPDKYLSSLDAWAIAFGCMVGWGAFVMPGSTFLPVAGPGGTLISMTIGLAVMLLIGYCVSYLMVRSPRPGGIYSFTKEAFGRDHAFLCSWFLCLSYLTIVFLNGTALFLVIRTLLGASAHRGYSYSIAGNAVYLNEVALSIAAFVGVGMLFIIAKSVLRRLATALAVVLFLGSLVIACVCLPKTLSWEILSSFGYQGVNRGFAIFSLIILAPWAFVGFEVLALDTAHFKFPVKKSGPVIVIAIVCAALVYMLMVLISLSSSPDGYASWVAYISDLNNLSGIPSLPPFYAAGSFMGPFGIALISITALAAILTGIIGAYRAIIHMLAIMAEDKILSDRFTKTTYSIFFIMVLVIVISLLGRNTLSWFVDLTSFGAIVAYGYTSAAAYKIARTEGNRKIMAAGLVGTLLSLVLGCVQIVPNLVVLEAMGSEAFLLLSLWCLLGFVFYWQTAKRSSLAEYSGMSTSGVVLFALLVYGVLMWLGKLLARQKDLTSTHTVLVVGGIVAILIIFIGLIVMLYVLYQIRAMHEAVEREKIRVAEGSLARSQFLFNMSHDIRTPMNAIIGYTTLALKEPDNMLRGYLTKIEKSSQQLLTLINDILEMSRIENGRIELEYNPMDLRMVLDEAGELFADQMERKKIDFSVHSSQLRNRYVWCDKKSLSRILLNLISNAFKFTPEGGTVSVSIYESSSGDAEYGSYEIRVQDSGIGMSKEFVAKMFNAFERERTSTASGIEGTGLGLSITKSIVDLMGGTIEVFTSPGNGTEIIIHVKFRIASEADMKEEADLTGNSTEEQVVFTGKRLLLVEAMPSISKSAR